MLSTQSLWFDISIFLFVLLIGNILMAHFNERVPRLLHLSKTLVMIVVFIAIDVFLGRFLVFSLLGVLFIPLLYVHAILLPKKGINGWTGEPKAKYYDLRGWDKNIF